MLFCQLVRRMMTELMVLSLQEVMEEGEGTVDLYLSLLQVISDERQANLTAFGLRGEIPLVMQEISDLRKEGLEVVRKQAKQQGITWSGNWSEDDLQEFWDVQASTYVDVMSQIIILSEKPYWTVRDDLEKIDGHVSRLPARRHLMAKALLVPGVTLCSGEARNDAVLGNAILAIGVRIYKQRHGSYPASLSDLVPGTISVLPKDPFTGDDYVYRRRRDGVLIYSLGPNGRDDGGVPRKKHSKDDFDIVWSVNR